MPRALPFTGDRAREAGRRGGLATALSRRAERQPWQGSIVDMMDLADMQGAEWSAWRAFWKACYALPMTPEERAIYQRHTQRDIPPAAPVAESFLVCGRGSGKTRASALHALYRGLTWDRTRVADGELVTIPLFAKDRRQARQALGYVRGFCTLPGIAPYVFRHTLAETVELKTGVNIEIATATFRGSRGYTSPTVCADEIAFWFDDGANPDHEIVTAVRGTLGRVPGSLLLVLSSPYAPRGVLYEAVEQSYGRDDPDTLVWLADTRSMNPTFSARAIERAFRRDPVTAGSEFGSDGTVQFRQARQALLDEAPLRQCIVTDRRELPPVAGTPYVAFVDAAEGSRSGDPMTLAIAHRENSRAVLDCVRETEPPYDPAEVVHRYAEVLHDYGIRTVVGDRHALGFVSAAFAARGITFSPSLLSKSDLFSELLPLVNTGALELLDHPTLRAQLLGLERRSVRGGRDSIDHPRGAHDDVANAAAGALVLVTGVGVKKRLRARVLSAPLDGRDAISGGVRVGRTASAGFTEALFG